MDCDLLYGGEQKKNTPICSFFLIQNQEDWGFFSQVFYTKEYSLFEYQACSLLDEEGKFGKWSIEENAMLSSIIHSSENSKWNEIAKILFVTSCKTFLRSSKQCR